MSQSLWSWHRSVSDHTVFTIPLRIYGGTYLASVSYIFSPCVPDFASVREKRAEYRLSNEPLQRATATTRRQPFCHCPTPPRKVVPLRRALMVCDSRFRFWSGTCSSVARTWGCVINNGICYGLLIDYHNLGHCTVEQLGSLLISLHINWCFPHIPYLSITSVVQRRVFVPHEVRLTFGKDVKAVG